jgi:hypothetical protein
MYYGRYMENNTVSSEEKLVVTPEKVVETPAVVPKPRTDLSKAIIALLVLVVVALGVAVFVLYNRTPTVIEQEPVTPVTSAEVTVVPATPSASPTVSVTPTSVEGTVYKNEKYGFEFTYDDPYKVLVGKDDLYGYPNGVALIYNGGQAYDIVVEAWDTVAAYETEHAGNLANLTAFESKGKFITFYDNTQELGNKKIIGSVSVLP